MEYLHRVVLVGFLAAACTASSQEMGDSIPASERPCNVSCGFDHSNPPECLQSSAVLEYWHRDFMGSVYPKTGLDFRKRAGKPLLLRQSSSRPGRATFNGRACPGIP